jgi:hypothetical protein
MKKAILAVLVSLVCFGCATQASSKNIPKAADGMALLIIPRGISVSFMDDEPFNWKTDTTVEVPKGQHEFTCNSKEIFKVFAPEMESISGKNYTEVDMEASGIATGSFLPGYTYRLRRDGVWSDSKGTFASQRAMYKVLLEPASKSVKVPKNGQNLLEKYGDDISIIYIKRPANLVGSALRMNIYIDGQIVQLRNGNAYEIGVPNGKVSMYAGRSNLTNYRESDIIEVDASSAYYAYTVEWGLSEDGRDTIVRFKKTKEIEFE